MRLPRMRGDPPVRLAAKPIRRMSTPHARGSTRVHLLRADRVDVYPACAGIHRSLRILPALWLSLPRMRGDPPQNLRLQKVGELSTPHARGSTFG